MSCNIAQKATIHQVTTMLATTKNVVFPSHNHLLTTVTNDLTLWSSPKRQLRHQYQWLADGDDLDIGHF